MKEGASPSGTPAGRIIDRGRELLGVDVPLGEAAGLQGRKTRIRLIREVILRRPGENPGPQRRILSALQRRSEEVTCGGDHRNKNRG